MRIGLVSRVIANPKASLDDLVAEARELEDQGFASL